MRLLYHITTIFTDNIYPILGESEGAKTNVNKISETPVQTLAKTN